jgi:hypothetical protein
MTRMSDKRRTHDERAWEPGDVPVDVDVRTRGILSASIISIGRDDDLKWQALSRQSYCWES